MDNHKTNHLFTISNRLAYTWLSLNYCTFYESVSEGEVPDKVSSAFLVELNDIVQNYILADLDENTLRAGIEKIDSLRNQMVETMKALTLYVDHLQVYEYVLNRIEYRLKEIDHIEMIEDESFTDKIMSFLLSGDDNIVINKRIQDVVAQLPIRITRSKFYSYLKDGLSIYQNTDQNTLNDMIYMLSTSAMVIEPSKKTEPFNELWKYLQDLNLTDFKTIEIEEFMKIKEGFIKVSEKINDFSGFYLLFQEVVNNIYIILLSTSKALVDVKEKALCEQIIFKVFQLFSNESQRKSEEEVYDLLVELEGRQEKLYEKYLSLLPSLETLQLKDEKSKEEKDLLIIDKLLSGSSYAELSDDQSWKESVTEDYMEKELEKLIGEFDQLFTKYPKVITRGIMAKVLSCLPVLFNSVDELRNYIYGSLASCSDLYEKAACIELIEELMESEDEMA